jgi:hypothetical protein
VSPLGPAHAVSHPHSGSCGTQTCEGSS